MRERRCRHSASRSRRRGDPATRTGPPPSRRKSRPCRPARCARARARRGSRPTRARPAPGGAPACGRRPRASRCRARGQRQVGSAPAMSFEMDHGRRLSLADQAIDARAPRLLVRVARHAVAKRRQLGVGVRCELQQRVASSQRARTASIRLASSARSRSSNCSRASPRSALRAGPCRIQLPYGVVDRGVQRAIVAGAQRGQPCDHAFEMSRKRRRGVVTSRSPGSTSSTAAGNAHGAAPLVEDVEDVRFAELDAHRPTARALGVVALEVPIDAAARDRERHAARRPAADLLERRADDANQVPVVLAAEMRLHLSAVLGCVVCSGSSGRCAQIRRLVHSSSPSTHFTGNDTDEAGVRTDQQRARHRRYSPPHRASGCRRDPTRRAGRSMVAARARQASSTDAARPCCRSA